ncbi:MAG: hypothetical protein ACRCXY_10960 [Fusobacteriaceae bacterium]
MKKSCYNLDFCNNIGKNSDIEDFEFDLYSIKEIHRNDLEKKEYYEKILLEWEKLDIAKKRIVYRKIKKSNNSDYLEIIREIKKRN